MKTLPMLALAGALMLGGCATTGSGDTTGGTISQVQSITQSVCAFLPTAETIAALLAGNKFDNITSLANAICAAVTAKSLRRGAGRPTVKGVPIRGAFVRR